MRYGGARCSSQFAGSVSNLSSISILPARIPSTMSGVSGASRRIRLTDGFLSPSASKPPVTGSC